VLVFGAETEAVEQKGLKARLDEFAPGRSALRSALRRTTGRTAIFSISLSHSRSAGRARDLWCLFCVVARVVSSLAPVDLRSRPNQCKTFLDKRRLRDLKAWRRQLVCVADWTLPASGLTASALWRGEKGEGRGSRWSVSLWRKGIDKKRLFPPSVFKAWVDIASLASWTSGPPTLPHSLVRADLLSQHQ
jgi:hypothetical protein